MPIAKAAKAAKAKAAKVNAPNAKACANAANPAPKANAKAKAAKVNAPNAKACANAPNAKASANAAKAAKAKAAKLCQDAAVSEALQHVRDTFGETVSSYIKLRFKHRPKKKLLKKRCTKKKPKLNVSIMRVKKSEESAIDTIRRDFTRSNEWLFWHKLSNTKQFRLCQSRQRVYMLAIRQAPLTRASISTDQAHVFLDAYWCIAMQNRPQQLLSDILLPETDPLVRCHRSDMMSLCADASYVQLVSAVPACDLTQDLAWLQEDTDDEAESEEEADDGVDHDTKKDTSRLKGPDGTTVEYRWHRQHCRRYLRAGMQWPPPVSREELAQCYPCLIALSQREFDLVVL